MATTLHQNHPITFSYIEHERSVQFSPVFEPNRRHNEPRRQKNVAFSCERALKKNTRTVVHGQYRHETGHSTNQTNRRDTWTSLVPFFLRAGPLKATFEHHTGRRGADRCFEEGRVGVHSALVRHTRMQFQPEANGNTPQPIVRTRDLERLNSLCGADERAK